MSGLRRAATVVLVAGATGSFVLMLRAGRAQKSVILMLLYTFWVISPYAALVAMSAWKRWPGRAGAFLDGTKLLLALGSLAVYAAVVFGSVHLKAGFTFLAVPLACWMLIGFLVAIAWFSDRQGRQRVRTTSK